MFSSCHWGRRIHAAELERAPQKALPEGAGSGAARAQLHRWHPEPAAVARLPHPPEGQLGRLSASDGQAGRRLLWGHWLTRPQSLANFQSPLSSGQNTIHLPPSGHPHSEGTCHIL